MQISPDHADDPQDAKRDAYDYDPVGLPLVDQSLGDDRHDRHETEDDREQRHRHMVHGGILTVKIYNLPEDRAQQKNRQVFKPRQRPVLVDNELDREQNHCPHTVFKKKQAHRLEDLQPKLSRHIVEAPGDDQQDH